MAFSVPARSDLDREIRCVGEENLRGDDTAHNFTVAPAVQGGNVSLGASDPLGSRPDERKP